MPEALSLDFANCMSDRIGAGGLSDGDLEGALPGLDELTGRLRQTRGTGWERWRDLPFDPMRQTHLDAIRPLVGRLRPETDNLLVLGIGGSALGLIAVQAALTPVTYNLLPQAERGGPRLFVLDNVDPGLVGQTLAEIRRTDPGLERTVLNVVSKSGETAETAAQFLIVRDMLQQALGERHAERIVAVTDPDKGTMRSICDREGYATLPVPEGVGGRFSVLSPVGLFGAAMCGIDIGALLDGAAAMDRRCDGEARNNPAAILAWILVESARRGRSNHVLMPYRNALYLMADWFRQLWAESLGKRVDLEGREVNTGATPIKALGATDQHSQIQLYREGPDDKVVGFVDVADAGADVTIPTGLDAEPLRYLQGASLETLLTAERRATTYALVESGRPSFTLTLPRLDAASIGQFIQLWELVTAYAGLMLNVDAYDQPAVETGKVATFGLMGREGFEQWRTKVDGALGESQRII